MKGMLQIAGVRNMKSAHSVGLRSIPKVQRSNYLELYVLGSERTRLEKEIQAIDKRRNAAQRQLETVCKRIAVLHEETHKTQEAKTCRDLPGRPLKKMVIDY